VTSSEINRRRALRRLAPLLALLLALSELLPSTKLAPAARAAGLGFTPFPFGNINRSTTSQAIGAI
jgi:hypothetical protein